MKTTLEILKRDLRALIKNPIALLVVGALLVLPGLYAWYCIVANWDPYSNTGSVPVAVVNEDVAECTDTVEKIIEVMHERACQKQELIDRFREEAKLLDL